MKVLVIDDANRGVFAGSLVQNIRNKLGADAAAVMPRRGKIIELMDG